MKKTKRIKKERGEWVREEADGEDGVGVDDSPKEVKLFDAESLKVGTGEN